jgi:hypothetical protein
MRRRNLIALGIGSVATLAIMYILITSPRRNFDRFLKEVATVEIGKTKLEDWRSQVNRAHISNVSFRCDQGVCGIGCRGENRVLWRLRLARRTIASGGVEFKDGVASEIYVMLAVQSPEQNVRFADPLVVVRQSTDAPCDPHYRVAREHYMQVGVGMSPCVSAQDRARALAINTSCLTRIAGCRTVESILPQVFAHP